MADPIWVALDVILAIHDEQLAEHCGQPGVRDQGLLESALSRPRHQLEYGEPSIPRLAASYAFGISRNHPFLDGNKRAGLICALVFLGLNGYRLDAGEDELTDLVMGVAAGRISKAQAAVFVDTHARRRRR